MQLAKENEVMEQFDMKKWSDKHLEEGPISWLKNKFKGKGKGKGDEEQITYTDKEGEKGEMSATGAKRLPDDHPAKIAWLKTQDKGGDEQGTEKVKGADMFNNDEEPLANDVEGVEVDSSEWENMSPGDKVESLYDDLDNDYHDKDKAKSLEDTLTNQLGDKFGKAHFSHFNKKNGTPNFVMVDDNGDETELTLSRNGLLMTSHENESDPEADNVWKKRGRFGDKKESKTSMVGGRFDINEWKNNTSKRLIKRTK